MREVEAQLVGIDQRAGLMHRTAEHVAQRVMQDVGRGMIEARGVAAEAIDFELDARAAGEVGGVAAQDAPDMNDRAFGFARVGHFEKRARCGLDNAAVADLAAAFGIEDCLGDDDGDVIAVLAAGGEHFGLAFVVVVADEARRGAGAETELRRNGVILARGASALLLLVHQAVEAGDIDVD